MIDKLNIGCGKAYLPGFLNLDLFSNVKADAYHDMTALPYAPESFSLIYACHVLEHQHRHMIVATLSHWRTLLKPGGLLRLAVPNFTAVANHYEANRDMRAIMGLLYGGQDGHLNRHTVAFDDKYLVDVLYQAGFPEVRWWDWRTTEHAQFDDFSQCYLPHMDKENGMLMSLNLEAPKV